MMAYGDRRDSHAPTYPERRHQEYNHGRRLHEPSYTPQAPYNAVLPQPYSPPGNHYSPSTITPSNPYVNASVRRPAQKSFSPNQISRPGDYNPGRRFSTIQANSLPPLQQHITHDPTRDLHPNASQLQDARRSSNNERMNGQSYSTETTWPPPKQVPVQQPPPEWFNTNGSMGYQGANEGYRG